MAKHRRSRSRLPKGTLATLALVGLLAATPLLARARNAAADSPATSAGATADTSASGTSAASTPAPAAASARATAPARSGGRGRTTASGSGIDAYAGLGSWVDIYDDRALANPAATVRNMAANGVTTLFIETGNSGSPAAVMYPKKLDRFIREAHKRDMYVVAWYLPNFKSVRHDAARVEKAIRFRTTDGQRFDSFALDIESDSVTNVRARNRRLAQLTKHIRRSVGPDYPLGAIIPSPLDSAGGYWRELPYGMIAANYDVFAPMSYYTFRTRGAGNVRSRTIADVRRLRSRPGCSDVPIHMIGGLSDRSSAREVGAFVSALQATGVAGGSMYAWSGTNHAKWQRLRPLAK